MKVASELVNNTTRSQRSTISDETPDQHSNEPVTSPKKGPLIVDGSINSPRRRRPDEPLRVENEDPLAFSASTSDDLAFDTPSSSDEQSQDLIEVEHIANGAIRSCSNSGSTQSDGPGDAKLANGHIERPPKRQAVVNGREVTEYGPLASEKATKPTLLPWSLGRQLSAVQEVRTPSPGLDRGNATPASLTSNARHQGHSKAKPSDSNGASQDLVALFPRPNGITASDTAQDGASAPKPSSWQTQKKKKNKKKTVKSENDVQGLNDSGGEVMPREESQRKGG
jgi:hypothetical protein